MNQQKSQDVNQGNSERRAHTQPRFESYSVRCLFFCKMWKEWYVPYKVRDLNEKTHGQYLAWGLGHSKP